MPFVVQGVITDLNEDGSIQQFARGQVVSDAVGARLQQEHPALVTRVAHDDDLCDESCPDGAHAWAQRPAAAPAKAAAQAAPAAPADGGEK